MRNKGLCTESIRAIQQYFALLTFDQGVHAHQSGLQPKFSGLCTRTNQSHLALFSIDRNAIGCYDFVSIGCDSSKSTDPFLWRSIPESQVKNDLLKPLKLNHFILHSKMHFQKWRRVGGGSFLAQLSLQTYIPICISSVNYAVSPLYVAFISWPLSRGYLCYRKPLSMVDCYPK